MNARFLQPVVTLGLVLATFWSLDANDLSADDLFQDDVVPVLQRRCFSCHNDEAKKGGFSLQSKAAAFADGYIEPGDVAASYLVDMVSSRNGKAKMPKNADPLSEREVAAISKWIENGANWPTDFQLSNPQIADLDWWSLKPLVRQSIPEATGKRSANPVDDFIDARLNARGLQPAQPADPIALVRRIYFDLIGLPPTPEQVSAYLDDKDPAAYEKLVDQLLSSPRYGERWARHWLDVVHYADTHGYDKDKPRPNAWPYRDYVIRSLNEDKPYSRFVREQLAGDVLWPDSVDGITATGFIAAGPWDFIGHAEVPESKIDGKVARNLDRDDMVTSTFNTFCSTTVQCARCHNHKFDPIAQEHYYSLQAVFAALDRADREFDIDSGIAEQRAELADQLKERQEIQKKLAEQVARFAQGKLKKLDDAISKLEKQKQAGSQSKPEFGYHSKIEKDQSAVKWVQVDLGKSTRLARIEFVGCHDTFNNIGHGFGFPVRYKIESADDESFTANVRLLEDKTASDVSNPGTTLNSVSVSGDITARFVRFTATKLAHRSNDYIFALAELRILNEDRNNVALGKRVTSLDSIQAPVRWQRKNLVDGYYFGIGSKESLDAEIAEKRAARQKLFREIVPNDLRDEQVQNEERLAALKKQLSMLPKPQRVYAGTIHHGSGNFVGTGAKGGKPRTIRVLHRGNVQSPLAEVRPGTLPLISQDAWEFSLGESHTEGERRVALADWIVREDNPLTWRSIVNRVWQYHFGKGLVDSPNDFGRMGQSPSHPELLDWLAVEFRDGGDYLSKQSLKSLHRLLVTSRVYRQASTHHVKNAKSDSENRFLWRMNRRRLTAEEVRDSVLLVSGKMNYKMFGAGFRAFVLERPQHSPHYEYHKYDPDDESTHRRSIYRFVVRSQPDPFMTTLDCADSSQSVAKRDETVTALQALALLNNKFMLRMAEHFAERLPQEAGLTKKVEVAFQSVTGRPPSDIELAMLVQHGEKHGLKNVCRLLFNLNEFVFVD